MARYAQIDMATGRVISVSELTTEVEAQDMIPIPVEFDPLGYLWDGQQFMPLLEPRNEISIPEFLDRWEFAELTALYARAETDVQAKVWIDWVKARPAIRLDNKMAQDGKAAVVAWGVLTAARADEIFSY